MASSLATALALPLVVIALFSASISDDLYVVAAVPALVYGTWNIGALVAGRVLSRTRTIRYWAFAFGAVRAATTAILAWYAFQFDGSNPPDLWPFFVVLAGFGLSSGATSTGIESLLSKAFESSTRATLFASRALWGVVTAAIAGVVVRSVFADEGVAQFRAFGYLYLAAAGAFASAAFFTLLLKEPARRLPAHRTGATNARATVLRMGAFQRYALFRIVLAAVAMLDVFIVVYAVQELSVERGDVGVFVIAYAAALAVGLAAGRGLSRRRGGRATLQATAWLKLLAPLLLLTIPYLRESADVATRSGNDRLYLWLATACFAAIGASHGLQVHGNFQYLCAIVQPHTRQAAFDLTNIIMAVATLFPFVAAWIVERWMYERLFAVAAACSLFGVLLSGILVDRRVVNARERVTSRSSRASTT